MNIFSLKYILLFALILLYSGKANSQIKATANRVDSTEYAEEATLGKDPIYFFYTPNENGHDVGGDLTANYNNEDTVNYLWYQFSKTTNAFDSLIFQENEVVSSKYTQQFFDTAGAGYRVHIENTIKNIDTSWHTWVFASTFQVSRPRITKSDCETMAFNTEYEFDEEFEYRDLTKTDSVLYKYNAIDSLYWNASDIDNKTDAIILPKTFNPSFPAPTMATKFNLTVKDSYNQPVYTSIEIDENYPLDENNYTYLRAVKVDFEPSRYFLDTTKRPDGETDSTGQAPLKVQFKNLSENAELFKWIFYDYNDTLTNLPVGRKDSITENRPLDSILYTYPGTYNVELNAVGPEFYTTTTEYCTDSMTKEMHIEVEKVFIPNFMNVFTPDGDDKNAIFWFENKGQDNTYKEPKSIKVFSIKIYSRWGTRVHAYEGKMEDWEGWDGETPGIGTAKTGVYFYVAFVTGYDGQFTKKDGFIHLFR